jgi:hypothetical protein
MEIDESPQDRPVSPFTLRSIYVRNSSIRTDDHFDPLVPGQQLKAIFRTGEGRVDCREVTFVENDQEGIFRSCAFTTRFEFAYVRRTEGDEPVSDEDIEKAIAAQITVDITVDYLISLQTFPDGDALSQWAHGPVIFHAWPYWREYCHATMLRMNLPVTMIPLLQAPTTEEVAREKSAAQN